jgi:iron complex transport system substrate-binding protein
MASATLCGLEVTDSLDRTVTFEEGPERIVIAGRGLLMVADAVYMFPEAHSRVIACEKISQGKGNFLSVVDPHWEQKRELPFGVGAEEIAALEPDVVLLKNYMQRKLGNALEQLNIKVLYFDLETPSRFFREISTIGKLLGNPERAEEIIGFYKKRMEQVSTIVSELPSREKPGALLLYYSERGGEQSFNAPPASWLQTILVEKAGGDPVWKHEVTGRGWMKIGFEQIASWNPEFVFITSYFSSAEKVVERLHSDALWSSMRAVKEENLFAFPEDFYSWDQPDPRWILGLEWLATRLHPRAFDTIDMQKEIRLFYKKLYGLSDKQIEEDILPVLTGDIY